MKVQGDVAWLTTKLLFILLGVMCLVSFFATLHPLYFSIFAVIVTGTWCLFYHIVSELKRRYVTHAN
jgi:hypothetical protein